MRVLIEAPLLRITRIEKDRFELTLLPTGVIKPKEWIIKNQEAINIRMPPMLADLAED